MDTSGTYIKMCGCPEIQGQKFKGNEFTISYKNPNIWIEHEGNFLYAKHDVWLPRQDQIQEMLKKVKTPDEHDEFLNKFYRFCFQGRMADDWPWKRKEISYEQLWLAFYVHEKHQKKWDGKKWVKI